MAGEPAFADVADSIAGLFDDRPGNRPGRPRASFAVGRLHLEYSRVGSSRARPDGAVLDTMRLPDLLGVAVPSRSRTAAACCAAFEVTNFRPHDPVSDATATAGVLLHLLRAAARRGWTDLGRLHSRAGGATTASVESAAAEAAKAARVRLELPAEHLPPTPSSCRLSSRQQSWTSGPPAPSNSPACAATSSTSRQPSP